MGINKDKKLDISNTLAYIKYKKEIYPKETINDRNLKKSLIEEINSCGYYIQGTWQISFMDKNDFKVVNPILMKYIGKFDKTTANEMLCRYLGKKGNYKALDFLLNEFKRPNDIQVKCGDAKWNDSRRGYTSSAIEAIGDKTRYKEYIEIIENDDTSDDSIFFIYMIGNIKNIETYECLKRIFNKNNIHTKIYAVRAISKFKDKSDEILKIITPYKNDAHEVMRTEVRKAIKKLSKRL